jgi:predicted nucleic acid-binding protein
MEQQQYLIDTNVVIDYLAEMLPASAMAFMNNVIDVMPLISVVTKIEILGFNAPEEHYQLLKDFMNDAKLIGLTDEIIDTTIEVRKNHKIKLLDAIIAASALVNRLTLISRNTKDFQNIGGLNCVNPYDL